MYEAQYRYIKRNKEQYAAYALERYHRLKNEDPEKFAEVQAKGKAWRTANRDSIRAKQRKNSRQRKLDAINYLGGECKSCKGTFHPAVYEFHHRDPVDKDRDPSKMLSLKWERVTAELDKCDLLCANCHRVEHHNWELNDV